MEPNLERTYELLQHNKKQYKHPYSFYRTADQVGMTPSELGKFFAKSRRSQSQRAASNQMVFAYKMDPATQDFIETGESHD